MLILRLNTLNDAASIPGVEYQSCIKMHGIEMYRGGITDAFVEVRLYIALLIVFGAFPRPPRFPGSPP